MGAAKNPSRIIDGPSASWACVDEQCQYFLSASGTNNTIRIGQAVYLDVSQMGPDSNVPNDGEGSFSITNKQLTTPNCEIVVNSQSGNAGPLFGVVVGVTSQPGMTLQNIGGVPTWTNTSGSLICLTLTVRQIGFAYVACATTQISTAPSILVGSTLTKLNGTPFATTTSSPTIGAVIGTAIASAINTYQVTGPVPSQGNQTGNTTAVAFGAPMGPGLVSIIPNSLTGIVPGAMLLIDNFNSGVQEAVSVGSVSVPAFKCALQNAHQSSFSITGPNTGGQAVGSVLISTTNNGTNRLTGMVAAWVNVLA